MTERRYSETEAAEIFRAAAEAEQMTPRALVPTEGLTIGELQEIGREAGLRPEFVARAALATAAGGAAKPSRFLGLPIGVSRTIELDTPFSDKEWEQLVADLRETFEAKGVIRYDGPFRQWSNGNLHVLVEPTPTAHRIRFRTTNGLSRSLMSVGTMLLAFAGATVLMSGDAGSAESTRSAMLMALMGVGMLGYGALRLPTWARRRQKQMDTLAERHGLARPT